MKKLLKNKKFLMGAISVMIGISILMAGLSYAWFTSSGNGDGKGIVTMGTLNVIADVDNTEQNLFASYYDWENYNNLTYLRGQTGYIKNIGTLDAFAKLTFKVSVINQWNENIGNPDNIKAVLIRNDNFSEIFDQDQNYELGGEWYFKRNGEADYNYYVELWEGDEFEFEYAIVFDMNVIDNKYQGAKIVVEVEYNATNNIDEAIAAELFGGDINFKNSLMTFSDDVYQMIFGGGSLIHPASIEIPGLNW